jgi:signal transduction histidine kinase
MNTGRPPTPILLVEDDVTAMVRLKLVFKPYPDEWRIYTATSVDEALEKLATYAIELAILDVHFEEGNAVDLIRASGSVPCMICTRMEVGETFNNIFTDDSVMQNIVGILSKPLPPMAIWYIRAALRVGATWREQNRLVAEATAQVEEERRAIAQNLHDDMGCHLMQLAWTYGTLQNVIKNSPDLSPSIQSSLGEIVERGKSLTNAAKTDLSKIVTQIRPEAVSVSGLRGGIDLLVAEWQETAPDVCFELEAEHDLGKVDLRRAGVIYRIVQEGITNAMRHAQPVSIHVQLCFDEKDLTISIRSKGSILLERNHCKLTTLRERTSSLGGVLRFTCDPKIGESLLRIVIAV